MSMRILLAGVALTVMLTACDRTPDAPAPAATESATLPMSSEEQLAPSAEALPEAPPAPLAEAPAGYDEDAYWDEASRADTSYNDRAPDYAFDYGGQEPAAWTEGGDILRLVERLVGGGERSYYYRRGEDRPYYVRDPDFAYGYDSGKLVTVYDSRSRKALGRDEARQRSGLAGRYLARSQDLRRAAAGSDASDRRPLDGTRYREWQARADVRQRQDPERQARRAHDAERAQVEQNRDRIEQDRDQRRLDRDSADRGRVPATTGPAPATLPAQRPDRDSRRPGETAERGHRQQPGALPAPVVKAPAAPVTPVVKPAPAGKDMTPAERKAARGALEARMKGTPQKQAQ